MHILIFFFAGAYFAKLDSFIIYAVVCAVYFFRGDWSKRKRRQRDLMRADFCHR